MPLLLLLNLLLHPLSSDQEAFPLVAVAATAAVLAPLLRASSFSYVAVVSLSSGRQEPPLESKHPPEGRCR